MKKSLIDAFFANATPRENLNYLSEDQLKLVSKSIPQETPQAGNIVVEHFNVGNSVLLLCNKSMIDVQSSLYRECRTERPSRIIAMIFSLLHQQLPIYLIGAISDFLPGSFSFLYPPPITMLLREHNKSIF